MPRLVLILAIGAAFMAVTNFGMGAPSGDAPRQGDFKTVTQPRTTEENHREHPRVMYNHWLGKEVREGRMTDDEAFRLFRQRYPDAGK